MNAVVTGTFEAENQAVRAVRKLLNSCVPSNCVRTIVPRTRMAAQSERGGIMVAVRASDHVSRYLAMKVLRDHGARDIENVNSVGRTTAGRTIASRTAARRSARKSLPPVQYPLAL